MSYSSSMLKTQINSKDPTNSPLNWLALPWSLVLRFYLNTTGLLSRIPYNLRITKEISPANNENSCNILH